MLQWVQGFSNNNNDNSLPGGTDVLAAVEEEDSLHVDLVPHLLGPALQVILEHIRLSSVKKPILPPYRPKCFFFYFELKL